METNRIIIILLNAALGFFGLFLGLFFKIPFEPLWQGFSPMVAGFFWATGFFVLSLAFFGFFTPLLFLYFGLANAPVFFKSHIAVIGFFVAALLGSSAGHMLAQGANKELNGKEKIEEYLKMVVILLVAGIILGILAGYIGGLGYQITPIKRLAEFF